MPIYGVAVCRLVWLKWRSIIHLCVSLSTRVTVATVSIFKYYVLFIINVDSTVKTMPDIGVMF